MLSADGLLGSILKSRQHGREPGDTDAETGLVIHFVTGSRAEVGSFTGGRDGTASLVWTDSFWTNVALSLELDRE